MAKFLVIQTAFIGDVILATSLLEKLNLEFPGSSIDFLVRKGNEGLVDNHPFIRKLLIWNKKEKKYKSLIHLIRSIRQEHYDYVINLQRFLNTGLITLFSGAETKIGFNKNPLSLCFDKRYPHQIDAHQKNIHEIDRNLLLISEIVQNQESVMPRLYLSEEDKRAVPENRYITVSPTSVWFTKQYPADRWTEMIDLVPAGIDIYLLGGKADFDACEAIRKNCRDSSGIVNLAGKLTFLQSAAYMKNAIMNYVNDSAPLHITSAVEAPVTAVFCSTTPNFGFGPLQSTARVLEVNPIPNCKPCGLHGFKACPLGHFICGEIPPAEVLGDL